MAHMAGASRRYTQAGYFQSTAMLQCPVSGAETYQEIGESSPCAPDRIGLGKWQSADLEAQCQPAIAGG
jgi:hypothetical protein